MAENPGLVITRVTGFGQDGPYAERAGYGSIGEAMGGLRYVMGEAGRLPVRAGISLGDALASVFAAIGTLAALQERARSGCGQVVDTAIYESVLALMESLIPEWVIAGYQREPGGAVLPNVAPSNLYPTADGMLVLVAANQDTVFARLATAMRKPELAADERFATHGARGGNMEMLDNIIGEWTATLTSADLLDVLHASGVPATQIYRARDMVGDPHFNARQALVTIPHPVLGDVLQQNVFPKLSRTPGAVRWAGPTLGQHNAQVYGDLLGLSEGELAHLYAEKVI